MPRNPIQLALSMADIFQKKLGEDIVILDLRKESTVTDFFVITTATSPAHARALARVVQEQLADAGVKPHHTEGEDYGQWILLDYLDVVAHIFLGEIREFYGLERLWGDVPHRAIPNLPDHQ
ncbi:MAG: ribosome silencing factor [candidate division WOR-3 bacterium]